MKAFIAGLFLGFSLILAIGAQNAFILKQGLRREHVFTLCFICALSDALLISVGVFGFSLIVDAIPIFQKITLYGGVLFLLVYGGRSFWAAFKKSEALGANSYGATPYLSAIALCLAFTWLNPHVYLDTVVLLGSVSAQFPGQKNQFTLGAVLASFVFFFSLGYGARILSPIFARPLAWKLLDFSIGVVMWAIALRLLGSTVIA